jgi:hypothetical protein
MSEDQRIEARRRHHYPVTPWLKKQPRPEGVSGPAWSAALAYQARLDAHRYGTATCLVFALEMSTEIARDLDREIASVLEDGKRLAWLEETIRHCPHAKFNFSDDEADDALPGFSIIIDGCDPLGASGPTLREAIDAARKETAP